MHDPGWPWPPLTPPPDNERALACACARLFASRDGRIVLSHLRRITLGVVLGPDVSDARLRHLEGQRSLVLSLLSLAARGQGAHTGPGSTDQNPTI
jgi:hypothetical protein